MATQGPVLQAEGAAHAEAVSGRSREVQWLEASGQGDGVGLGVGWGLPCAPVSLWILSRALGRPR